MDGIGWAGHHARCRSHPSLRGPLENRKPMGRETVVPCRCACERSPPAHERRSVGAAAPQPLSGRRSPSFLIAQLCVAVATWSGFGFVVVPIPLKLVEI
jgi:hypothetical protein